MRKFRRTHKAFTFLEIMFVVVIIGILAAIAVPRLVGGTTKARIGATKSNMKAIETALMTFEMKVGRFPTTEEGLKALVKCPSDVSEEDWDSQYLKEVPNDAWGEDFIYKYPGENNVDYDLASKGPDKQEDTEDDITNWASEDEEDL